MATAYVSIMSETKYYSVEIDGCEFTVASTYDYNSDSSEREITAVSDNNINPDTLIKINKAVDLYLEDNTGEYKV